MVLIKIKGKKYKCPTKWDEVTDFDTLISRGTLREEIETLTGASLEGISDESVFPLITLTSFMEEFDLPAFECADVNQESYYKLEQAKEILKLEGRAYRKLYFLSKLYHPDRTETVQILSTGKNILDQINLFLSAYEEMFTYEPEQEEINAGIEELSGFSALATLYNLAGQDLLKIDQIGNSPAVVVYGVLMYEFKKSQYQNRLNEIRYPNNGNI